MGELSSLIPLVPLSYSGKNKNSAQPLTWVLYWTYHDLINALIKTLLLTLALYKRNKYDMFPSPCNLKKIEWRRTISVLRGYSFGIYWAVNFSESVSYTLVLAACTDTYIYIYIYIDRVLSYCLASHLQTWPLFRLIYV